MQYAIKSGQFVKNMQCHTLAIPTVFPSILRGSVSKSTDVKQIASNLVKRWVKIKDNIKDKSRKGDILGTFDIKKKLWS